MGVLMTLMEIAIIGMTAEDSLSPVSVMDFVLSKAFV